VVKPCSQMRLRFCAKMPTPLSMTEIFTLWFP
jgi:hypothetical protein